MSTKPQSQLASKKANEKDRGIITGDYFKTGYIGSSWLKEYLRGPEYFFTHKWKDPTKDMIFGTAYHEIVLQPEIFKQKYCMVEGDFRKAEPKKLRAEAIAAGKHVFNADEWKRLQAMKASVYSHPKLYKILNSEVDVEKGIFVTHASGLKIQCKIDLGFTSYKSGRECVMDFKSAKEDADVEGFTKACRDRDYPLSDGFYTTVLKDWFSGLGKEFGTFFFCMTEKHEPHRTELFAIPSFQKDEIMLWVDMALFDIAEYIDKGIATLPYYDKEGNFVPGTFSQEAKARARSFGIRKVELPGYIMKKYLINS